MALDEDFELGDAVEADPDYADEHRDLREVYRRSQTPRQRMLRQAREGFERVPELTEDLLLPQSPLDVAAMAVLGPYGKVGSKAAAGALGLALEPSEAEAALGPGFSKRFFSPLVELVRNLNVNKPMPERAWRELLEPNPKTGKQARFRDARTGLEHPVTPDEWEFARGDEILRDLGNPKRFKEGVPQTITKDELADLLEAEYPALDTKILGARAQRWSRQERADRIEELTDRIREGREIGADPIEINNLVEELRQLRGTTPRNGPPAQYSGYRLKGPADDASYQESLTKYERGDPNAPMSTDEPKWEVFNTREGHPVRRFHTERQAADYIAGADDTLPLDYAYRGHGWDTVPADTDFVPRANHFNSEPNLLSHSRADRRTTVDGLKARHVDEFQSDWHQQARDSGGYHDPVREEAAKKAHAQASQAYDRALDAKQRAWNDLQSISGYDRARDVFDGIGPEPTDAERAALDAWNARHIDVVKARKEADRLFGELNSYSREGRPPVAPLRKNWHEVELKKQLAQAIEDGDELLTWTTGDQQIERYKAGLQAAVDELRWTRRPDGKYDIVPIKGGRPVDRSSARGSKLEGLSDKELEDTIGTEMAKKIRESEGQQLHLNDAEKAELQALHDIPAVDATVQQRARFNELSQRPVKPSGVSGTLTGDDLTVGGAGMRSFYDRTVVDTAKKLAKQYGGEYTRVKVPGERRSYDLARRADIENLFIDDGAFRQLDEAVSRYAHTLPEEKLDELSAQMGNLEDLRMETHREAKKEFIDEVIKLREMLGRTGRLSLDQVLGSAGTHDVHAIKITPQMREKLKAAGGKFSLYADGGAIPELPWEERARMASGGRASRELLDRLRRWLNEQGGFPVKELPEESYSALRSTLEPGEGLLYHGRTVDKRNMGEVDPERSLFLTAEPGVAEAYAWPDTNWNQGSGTSLVVPYRYKRGDVKLLRNLDDEYGVEGHHEYLNEVVENLPKRQRRPLYRFEIEDQVPLSEGLFDSRSQKFVERTYQLKEPELRQRLLDDEWPLVDHDQYFAPRAGSLRRWKRGGRT